MLGNVKIIQGGMGAAVSGWRLAQVVSRLGQMGVVSGTALDVILCRRLQEGDPGGHMRRALEHFPFPRLAQRILDAYFIPGGRKPGEPFRLTPMHTIDDRPENQELCVAGNFVEVFLAREGHSNPVGINYLEKIQIPHVASLYGAMLAGVAVVIMGAGIPLEIPAVISALLNHQPASYPIRVANDSGFENVPITFDPGMLYDGGAIPDPLPAPAFFPIVSSSTLATMLVRRVEGAIAGFVVEGPLAGGHNAPPRGVMKLTDDGQPIYGARDTIDVEAIRALGLPFWLAGWYGSAEGLRKALSLGAAGIQVGTAFALCQESELTPDFRRALIRKALAGQGRIYTDPLASPTGFPFKVACLEGTLSEPEVYGKRRRICDLGFLRELYRRPDGKIGYRCPAEPEAAYVAKQGKPEDTAGRKCLCNALVANIGMPQALANGETELALITLGDDYVNVGRFCTADRMDYTAGDVIRSLLA